MNNFFRFLQLFALGTWLGGILFLSFVVAPGAFARLGSREVAGGFVGFTLSRLHIIGVSAGLLFLLAGLLSGAVDSGAGRTAALIVALMVLLTGFSQWRVSARLADLRQQMVSVDSTPPDDSRRVEFDRLHKTSVRLEGAVMLLGFAALYLTARR
jgi:hypothetical protein